MKDVRRAWVMLLVLLGAVVAAPVAAQDDGGHEQVLMSPAEALREVFPGAAAFSQKEYRPSAAERSALEGQLGRRLYEESFPFLLVYDAQRHFLGYALVTEERGKYRPITFMVGVTPEVKVKDVAVMVYRESRGGEVRQERFLAQYRGKSLRNPIQANRDIINISGATISVHSMNAGVRKALAVVQTAFGNQPPALASGAALKPVGALR